jgi:hypothetical protein
MPSQAVQRWQRARVKTALVATLATAGAFTLSDSEGEKDKERTSDSALLMSPMTPSPSGSRSSPHKQLSRRALAVSVPPVRAVPPIRTMQDAAVQCDPVAPGSTFITEGTQADDDPAGAQAADTDLAAPVPRHTQRSPLARTPPRRPAEPHAQATPPSAGRGLSRSALGPSPPRLPQTSSIPAGGSRSAGDTFATLLRLLQESDAVRPPLPPSRRDIAAVVDDLLGDVTVPAPQPPRATYTGRADAARPARPASAYAARSRPATATPAGRVPVVHTGAGSVSMRPTLSAGRPASAGMRPSGVSRAASPGVARGPRPAASADPSFAPTALLKKCVCCCEWRGGRRSLCGRMIVQLLLEDIARLPQPVAASQLDTLHRGVEDYRLLPDWFASRRALELVMRERVLKPIWH